MKTGSRRKGRELALSILFAGDIGGQSLEKVMEVIDCLLSVLVEQWELGTEEKERLLPDIRQFGIRLAEAYDEYARVIDEQIENFSHEWALDRMPGIDRNILRLAIAELIHMPEVPVGATINEAVELAKIYGTEESGKFVNGILGALVRSEQIPVKLS
ncbi:MAG: transcription antitermination factor NusB [candidate division WS1 bacterium]|nr:transcription antitermination factor NusB [candidate division WS1 bacterium]